ncbi:uncharacterized protein LOC141597484 [Silene latifolia]|uniref:uncharacterized protein LOC141597484 n=1 Tax=Silene latifolia TaxID=37657 RepID=UPI003D771432
MNILSINCRGLGNPDTVSALRALVRREAPAIVFLCETKLCGREMRRARERLEGYFGMEVDSMGRSGGLAMLWKRDIDCVFMSSSVHHMDFTVRHDGKEWRLTGFYGWPAVSDRHLSWELLRLLKEESNLPWVCMGDYNEILFSTEMKGGSRPQRQMNNFRAAVDDCQLRDVPWVGYNFSFDNGQAGEANRQCMLDRALCSYSWLDLFPYARLHYLDREWSDHAPIKLVFESKEVGETRKLNINKIGKELEKKRKQLARFNEGDRSETNVQRRRQLVAQISNLRRQEEQYWRQRSRALWLKDGDRNTKFFHTRAGERKRKNFIAKLIDDDGVERVGTEEVTKVALDYFEGLFTSSNPSNFEDVVAGIRGRVTTAMNTELRRDYGEEEVLDALNQMHPLKAPGPDGMNGLFYQTYWSTVGPEVIRAVLAILRGERSPRDINKTNIVLIPKKKAPDKIRDFRPISLSNVVYKFGLESARESLEAVLGGYCFRKSRSFYPGSLYFG